MRLQINERERRSDKAKSWLWRYRKARIDVIGLEAEYESLLIMQESARAVRYDGASSSSGTPCDLSSLMVARERAMDSLVSKQREMSKACAEIIEVANRLEGRERDVVILRYVRLKNGYRINTFEEIADIIGYSVSQTKRIHANALKQIEKMILNEPK